MRSQQRPLFLQAENRQYAGTGGVSENNAAASFLPAFLDSHTGRIEISRFGDGRPAPCHLIDGLPDEWVMKHEASGRPIGVRGNVVSGFVRFGRFFTRQEADEFMVQFAP